MLEGCMSNKESWILEDDNLERDDMSFEYSDNDMMVEYTFNRLCEHYQYL
jgi:hypothetical protein